MKAKMSKILVKSTLAMIVGTVLGTPFAANAASKDKEVAGKAIIAKGTVKATESGSEAERRLRRRSPIYGVDVVTTGENSKTQLRMTDGGMIALKENSELLISDYEFNKEENTGSVVMELVKGGLRSVTGSIKSHNGSYQLKTPVGSIGIRGTHYEIEIIQGDVFIAVWDGAVDVNVDAGGGSEVSLGEGEDFSYAKIDENGEVTELLTPPENFNEGHSSDPETDQEQGDGQQGDGQQGDDGQGDDQSGDGQQGGEEQPPSGEDQGPSTDELPGGSDSGDNPDDQSGDPSQTDPFSSSGSDPGTTPTGDSGTDGTDPNSGNQILDPTNPDQELGGINSSSTDIASLVAQRTGTWEYTLDPSSLNFTQGSGTNASASLTIDFNLDTAVIDNGQMSFEDSGGEWFAAFNGIVNVDSIEMFVNFASHGNEQADGEFTNAAFTDGIDGIFSQFKLWEVDDTSTTIEGQFMLKGLLLSNP